MKKSALHLILLFTAYLGYAQDFNYTINLKTKSIDGLDGTHSYAFGTANGKWLIVGGRKDGIHARQPFNAFPAASNNTELMVVDVNGNSVSAGALTGLPANKNACFY